MPIKWQGWLVCGFYLALVGLGFVLFSSADRVLYFAILAMLMLSVLYAKGERRSR
jgi:hypothetical protein